MKSSSTFTREVSQGKRFEFGCNWRKFLAMLNDERIAVAEHSLKSMLEVDDLVGKRFLDTGSGSGLFSLAARRLGADVHSFDYDPQAVACATELKRRYFPDDRMWTIEEGSVLDREYLTSLGKFDIVYSWGVLHHTGALWDALENVCFNVAPGGRLFLAIYNDQGRASWFWKIVKRAYNRLPRASKVLILWPVFIRLWILPMCREFLCGKAFYTLRNYSSQRGMSIWRDAVDWAGGYPFEVAKPGEIFEFYHKKGFSLVRLSTTYTNACNEYIFTKAILD